MPSAQLKAPFPWFGGKSRVADIVWSRFGDIKNYVEPFFGSGAVLLGAPEPCNKETVNDLDGFVANFWRAVSHDAEAVARWADNPVNENDLHARHIWLVNQQEDFTRRLEGDPDYYDAKIAGWWCWGLCCWIGSGWCSGNGPWSLNKDRKLVHLGDAGRGVNRKRVHLGNAGQGVNRQLVHLGDAGRGVNRQRDGLTEWFEALQARLRRVRVCCGDWSRVCGHTPTIKQGLTGVFLDPPYGAKAKRCSDLYRKDSEQLSDEIEAWCKQWQDEPKMRIALCGYVGEYDLPDWECYPWKTHGGYGSESKKHNNPNKYKERIWFSPHCIKPDNDQRRLF